MKRILIFAMLIAAPTLFSSQAYAGFWDTIKNASQSIQGTIQNVKDTTPGTENQTSGSSTAANGSGNIISDGNIWDSYDFIPGDKMLFYDNFNNTDVGEFPRKWTIKGPDGGGNSVSVVEYKGQRWLRTEPGYGESTLYIRYKGGFPKKFTVEFDAVIGGDNRFCAQLLSSTGSPNANGAPGVIVIDSAGDAYSNNTQGAFPPGEGNIHHIAISVNGTFVKAYVDNRRVINDPNGLDGSVRFIGMRMVPGGGSLHNTMFTNFRVAAGGKDIQSSLDTDGKIVTHGILFNTGSAIIKPQSQPTLKRILTVLQNNPGMKFSIEGHTDNQGTEQVNQPLSEKRAQAVQAWFVSKGISADRLQAKGWGDSKPIASNKTAEGRADNRRVEFVKIR